MKRTLAAVVLALALVAQAGARALPFEGHQFKPRDMAWYLAGPWQNQTERIKALATPLGESKLFVGAFNDNLNADGELVSRDLGLFQISVTADRLEELEPKLRTDSEDPDEWAQVTRYNVAYAKQLWVARRWQPWVAYNTGWATFPEWWVWRHQRDPETGESEPTGPWVPTGRYLQKSIVGWANFHLIVRHDKTEVGALAFAKKQQAKWGVKGELGIRPNPQGDRAIAWLSFPPKPDQPPADGVGPRPIPNDGR